MIKCQNCGQINDYGVNFCRFCGTQMVLPQSDNNFSENYVQPRPYMWKTDEFQVKDNSPKKNQPINQGGQMPQQQRFNQNIAQPMTYPKPAYLMNQSYRCPRCNSQNLPYIKRQVSTAGWITFAVLLVFTGIFFLDWFAY